jgi:outer membrane protein assembly factor BamB
MKTTNGMIGVLGVALLLGGQEAKAQDWPQWRGPNRDNKATGFSEPKTWPKELSKKWKVPVGQGDSSPVLVGDRIFVFGRDGKEEVVACLDAASGREVWKKGYVADPATAPAGGIHAGPRSTPAVADGKICTLGVRGMLRCLDTASGKLLWDKDTKKSPQFFTSSSPLIVDGLCIVCLGDNMDGEIVAFDLANGSEKWKWHGGAAPYGSPVLLTAEGTRQIVTLMGGAGKGKATKGTLVSVGLDGKLLWQTPLGSGYSDTMPTPIVDGATVIYSAPQAGTMAFKVEKKEGAFTATSLWSKTTAAHKYNTPVLLDGVLYGFTAKGKLGTLFSMDAKTGETLWKDTTARGECGNVIAAGSVLVALSSDKSLVAFRPDKKAYTELASYKVADIEPWAAPILAGNRVYVKDQDSLTLWTAE